MKILERFELTLTASILAAFSIGSPWLFFAGFEGAAFVLGAGCICASALVFTVGYGAFGR